MLNLGQLATTVQKNCDISDAKYAGDYTLCIFLLKMREFYRWENDIPFSGALPKKDVGEWLEERERMWGGLESSAFEPLALTTGATDPFDSAAINRELVPQGYVYSGGYGRFSKPHFFLGELIKEERRSGFTVYISSCEYARDLVAPPAMLQGQEIFVRQESARRFLWEKVDEWRWNPKNVAMERALASYRYNDDVDATLDRMTVNETETMILHELGEGLAGNILGDDWNAMLDALSRSKAEIMARAARDLLADCLSTLPRLVERHNEASLHFYFANFSGMRKYLFPDALATYRQCVADADFSALAELAATGAVRWTNTARMLIAAYKHDPERADCAIEKLLEHTPIR